MKDIIIAPVVTEKSAVTANDGKTYVFKVDKAANKGVIKANTASRKKSNLAKTLNTIK